MKKSRFTDEQIAYALKQAETGTSVAEPLYSKSGAPRLVQFLTYLDKEYGGVDPFLETELGSGPIKCAFEV